MIGAAWQIAITPINSCHVHEQSEGRLRLAQAIVQALGSLPQPERTVFTLSHYRGYRLDEIARSSQMNLADVERLHESARRQLFARLNHDWAQILTESPICGGRRRKTTTSRDQLID